MALRLGLLALVATAARAAEQHDMRLVGAHDLQARSAYQPVIHQHVGHHAGLRLNRVPHWSPGVPGRTRDFVLLVSESLPRTKP